MRMTQDQADAVYDTLRTLFSPSDVWEIRMFKTGTTGTISGYFDDPKACVKALLAYDGQPYIHGIYVVMNPVKPELLERYPKRANRLETNIPQGTATADTDVACRRWLLIDYDPERKPKVSSSTTAEHDAALAKIRRVVQALVDEGWPEPILADSGNGWHALFPIDMSNDDLTAHLLKKCLRILANRFDDPAGTDPQIKLDATVFNAGRLTKLYGTMTRKGKETAERPHRRSALVEVPVALQNAEEVAL